MSEFEKDPEQIVVDGNVEISKIEFLIGLKYEEEKLDFKAGYKLDSKIDCTKCKIDLVCDIVAMTNAYGGYLIIGLEDGSFELSGVDDKNLSFLSEENIQNYLSGYVESNLRLKVKQAKIRNYSIVCICVLKSAIPIPFKKQGIYNNEKGKEIIKFRTGEIFTRHGSKSERANYFDYLQIVKKIRLAERLEIEKEIRSQEIAVKNFKEQNGSMTSIDLFQGTHEEIEFNTLSVNTDLMPFYFKRRLIRKFDEIENDVIKIIHDTHEKEAKLELADKKFEFEILKIIPIWMAAVQKNDIKIGKEISRRIYKLLYKVGVADDTYESDYKSSKENSIGSLYFIEKLVYLVYTLGAIAMWSEKLDFGRILVNKKVGYHFGFENVSWFRYLFIMLHRNNQMKEDFITKATSFGQQSGYLNFILENDNLLRIFIGSFDYFQCLNNLLDKAIDKSYYPNFMLLGKEKQIEPFIEMILDDFEANKILFAFNKEELKSAILKLDSTLEFSNASNGMTWNKGWESDKIINFINK